MSQHGITHLKKHIKSKKIIQKNIEIQFAENDENYCKVISVLGDSRFKLADLNTKGHEYIARVPRTFKRGKEIIRVDSIVKINPGIQPDQYYINHLYTETEIITLYASGEIKNISTNKDDDKDNKDLDDSVAFEGNQALTVADLAEI